MNERLKLLADQAEDYAVAEYEKWIPTPDFSGIPNIRKIFNEKFAELIVRECLGCSNNLANHYIDNHSEKEQTLLLASIADYSNEIKKHFGVEQ